MAKIVAKRFGISKNGETVTSFELSNSKWMKVVILDYGGTIQSLFFPNRYDQLTDIVLGYTELSSYEEGSSYYGAIVGRVANRIGGARFILDGKEYALEENEPHNHNHGVFSKRLFSSRIDGETLRLTYVSPDGEEGFPGELTLEVSYSLDEENALKIEYKAKTTSPTLANFTNHLYFNLNGNDGSTILNHKARLNCPFFTEYEESFSQTGRIIQVKGTPLDFLEEHSVGERFNDDCHQFRICTGYDHNMVLDGKSGELKWIGSLSSDVTGIKVNAYTTEPAIQFYSGNFIHIDTVKHGKYGIHYPKNGGICMEAQHYPDAINHENFPSIILRPNEEYHQTTIYRFETDK